MKEYGLILVVFVFACVACGKIGYDQGYNDEKAHYAQEMIKQARREDGQRCEDNTVYTKAVGGFWLDTGKRCKVLP